MKSLSKATFHLLCCILLLGTFQSCKDDETTPPPPGESATLTISDVKAEANTVTFTITPKNVDVYTYTIKSATVTPQATVQDPAETKTFTYNSLLPSSDYTIVATGFTQGGLELTSTEYKFRTLDTQDPGLEVPSGEEPSSNTATSGSPPNRSSSTRKPIGSGSSSPRSKDTTTTRTCSMATAEKTITYPSASRRTS